MLIIVGALLLLFTWFLVAPLVLQIDTRVPSAQLNWVSIGSFRVWYQEGWKIGFHVFFLRKTFQVADFRKKEKKPRRKKSRKHGSPKRLFRKLIRVLRSFRVEAWEVALDTDDYAQNAKLYPLNFVPALRNHLFVNFRGESYLYLKIRNRIGRILFAFLR